MTYLDESTWSTFCRSRARYPQVANTSGKTRNESVHRTPHHPIWSLGPDGSSHKWRTAPQPSSLKVSSAALVVVATTERRMLFTVSETTS